MVTKIIPDYMLFNFASSFKNIEKDSHQNMNLSWFLEKREAVEFH